MKELTTGAICASYYNYAAYACDISTIRSMHCKQVLITFLADPVLPSGALQLTWMRMMRMHLP